MPRPTPPHDPELTGLFSREPDLLELADMIRAVHPDPEIDPRFKNVLRTQLLEAAAAELRPRGLRSLLGLRSRNVAMGGGAFGLAAAAAALVILLGTHQNDSIQVEPLAVSPIQGQMAVDPSDAITVAFNQPMDHTTVLAALNIHPATSYTTTWSGNTLTITPAHRLAVNTPYTVRISHAVARNAFGVAPAGDIQISFGTTTGPVPTPSGPTPAPVLALQVIGSADPAASGVYAPDGTVVLTSQTTSPAASPSPSPAATSGSPPGSASPAATAGPVAELVHLGADGTWHVVGPATGALAYSPSGKQMAYISPGAGGAGGQVTVAGSDGSHPTALATTDTASSPIAWGGGDSIDFVSGGRLRSVNLQGDARTLAPITLTAQQVVVYAPGGRYVFVGAAPAGSPSPSPSATASSTATPSPTASPTATATVSTDATTVGGELIDLSTLRATPLSGSAGQATFSGDGSTVAWVDHAGAAPSIVAAPTSGGATTTVDTLSDSATVAGLALDRDGSRLADVTANAVFVRTVATGTVLAESDTGGRAVVWSPDGTRLLMLTHGAGGDEATQAAVPGTPPGPVTSPADTIAPAAAAVVTTFTNAQIVHDAAALQTVLGEAVSGSNLLPDGVTRGYDISMTTDMTGNVHATIRLIADSTSARSPTRAATETITVSQAGPGSPYQVTGATIGSLVAVPVGPQVIHVAQTTVDGTTTFDVAFDSDLDPTTVQSAISVSTKDGTQVDTVLQYDEDTRTVVVESANPSGGPLALTISTALLDVDGQPLPSTYVSDSRG